ncbi:hypothetical protein EXIGLDRAFT_772719 [Exidia glandulosa HHB12029]|uniref:SGNH hydrolase n=1 Tax=Exidia glandulosa HHB12029 TaxID=1314781 RepID=A0A166A4Q0_EXIGL|nr:hypothetical protein EXIGLDRAFT_772719 [Exidia glandulosa HHB12029]
MALRQRVLRSTGSPLNALLLIFNIAILLAIFFFQWPIPWSPTTVHCEQQVEVQVHQPPPSPGKQLPYAFCDTCGPGDALCQQYGAHNLARSRGYEGSNARLRRVLRDAERGRPIKVAVLGGSVTNGHGVKPDQNWVNLFGAWWNRTFPRSELTLQNGAVPATGSDYFSMCFGEHIDRDADLIVTELAVNDQRIESNTEAFEWLMRALLELPSQPAIINTQVFGLAYSMLSTGGDLHTSVSQYYDVPHISLRNVVLPHLLQDPSLDRYWFAINREGVVDHRHIGYNGHRALADLLIAHVQRQLCALHDSEEPVQALDAELPAWSAMEAVPRLRMMEPYDTQTVHHPLVPFCMSTRTTRHPLVPVSNDGWANWTYRGNRVKPYIRATIPGSKVSFRIVVGAMGRVRITYLKSAEFGLGTIKCWVDEDEARGVKVAGHWDWKGLNTANVFVVARGVSQGEHVLTCQLLEETQHPGGGTEFRLIAVDAA